jgi:hypothetical protein
VHVVPQQSLSPFARLLTQADADGSCKSCVQTVAKILFLDILQFLFALK